MAYFNEAPHTRNYDDDLRQLICYYKEVKDSYKVVIDTIDGYINELIDERFNTLMINAVYKEETETIVLQRGVLNSDLLKEVFK